MLTTPMLQEYLNTTKERDPLSIAYLAIFEHLTNYAPEVAHEMLSELKDQRSNLKLIASENYCSLSVQLAMGNWLTDKYAEGIPEKRFYAGCEHIDRIEQMGIDQLKELFSCDHAYIQPHSGADANLVAFWTILTHTIQDPEVKKLKIEHSTHLLQQSTKK